MILSLILAVSDNGVIGKDGKIPWFVRGEQKRFKEITMGHPIIMGRKTFETPKTLKDRPMLLPGRLNVVITRQSDYSIPEGGVVVHSLQEALDLDEVKKADEAFVIGGEEVLKEALPIADRMYLTKVHTSVKGDRFFSYDPSEWRQISSEYYKKDEVPDRPFDFEICLLERIK